jgi:hypothetical protein
MVTDADGFPTTGDQGLGVRLDTDFADFEADDGYVTPGMGGMSVNLDPWRLPAYRRPPFLGGTSKRPLWRIDSDDLGSEVHFVPGPAPSTHAVIEPRTSMSLLAYRDALAETRETWMPVHSVQEAT